MLSNEFALYSNFMQKKVVRWKEDDNSVAGRLLKALIYGRFYPQASDSDITSQTLANERSERDRDSNF